MRSCLALALVVALALLPIVFAEDDIAKCSSRGGIWMTNELDRKGQCRRCPGGVALEAYPDPDDIIAELKAREAKEKARMSEEVRLLREMLEAERKNNEGERQSLLGYCAGGVCTR